MNTIEEKLWSYIDGACTPEDEKAIALLIEQDEVYRRKYNELLKLNTEFAAIELDEPPMAFTYNVMEAVRAEHARQPLKATINKRIIRGIGLFFIFTISSILIFALASINWHAGQAGAQLADKLSAPIKQYFTGNIVKGFFFFDTVLVLFLLDSYFRKKGLAKAGMNVQTSVQQKEQ
jgi:hypothetical protein